jgi:hypothetical protein
MGKNPIIQFGNGNVLNIGSATASFNNFGSTWGLITLTGKISSSVSSTNTGTIYIDNFVSLTSMAYITNSGGVAVYHNSTGALTISGGTISKAGDGNYAVYNGDTGTVIIGAGATIVGNNYGL